MADGFICRAGARIANGSYTGTGSAEFTLHLPFPPKFICINYQQGMLCTTVQNGITVKSYTMNGTNTGHNNCSLALRVEANMTDLTVAQAANYLNQNAFTYYYTIIG